MKTSTYNLLRQYPKSKSNQNSTITKTSFINYKVEYDHKEMIFMPHYYGVTSTEMSINDDAQWPNLFVQVSDVDGHFSREELKTLFSRLNYKLSEDKINKIWLNCCKELFGFDPDTALHCHLNSEQTYNVLCKIGVSAKQIMDIDPNKVSFFKLYWNQTRMGGRDPSNVNREVTMYDAYAALGVDQNHEYPEMVQAVEELETRSNVILPSTLRTFLTRPGVAGAVFHSHPNNPSLADIDKDTVLRSGMRVSHNLSGDFALTLMIPHQGNHQWFAVFDDGDHDVKVYIAWYNVQNDVVGWKITAPTLGFFLWDLAQTGLGWYEDNENWEGPPIVSTDIGIAISKGPGPSLIN